MHGKTMERIMAAVELVDADAHVNPAPTFWDDYLPAKFAGRGPKWEAAGPGDKHDWLVFEGSRKPLNLQSATSGQGKQFRPTGTREQLRAGNWEPASRLADMDQDGVRSAVLYGGGPLGTADNELYLASFEAYNRWLADFCSYDARRLAGAAYLPMQDVAQSTAMVADAARRGLKAVNIPAFPQSGAITTGGFGAQVLALTGDPDGKRQYDDVEFDPFWRACVEHDIAVTIHLGARIARPGQFKFLPNMVMSKLCMAEPIAILIFGGVFDRFPELRFGTIESGAGWLAFTAEYMDTIYDNQRHWLGLDLAMKPSEYFDRNVYASFIRDPEGIRNRALPGGRNIMWSTDYPHSETTWPESRKVMDWQFAGVPEAEICSIVSDNAKRFYRL
jgi:predicted TIM-barrel fold metal-dependent hydrolase